MNDLLLKLANLNLRHATQLAQERAQHDPSAVPGDSVFSIEESQRQAIVAALIALAERKPQFVQVGPIVFDPNDISAIDDVGGELRIYFKAHHTRYFREVERTAFLRWWEQHADVICLDTEEAE